MHLSKEIVDTIVKLHQNGLGYRRVSSKIKEIYGVKVSKDKVMEVVKTQENLKPKVDKELERLGKQVEKEKLVKTQREERERLENEKDKLRKKLFRLKLENRGESLLWKIIDGFSGNLRERFGLYHEVLRPEYKWISKLGALECLFNADDFEELIDNVPECVDEFELEDCISERLGPKDELVKKLSEKYGPFKCPTCKGYLSVSSTRAMFSTHVTCPGTVVECDCDKGHLYLVRCLMCGFQFMDVVETDFMNYICPKCGFQTSSYSWNCPKCRSPLKKVRIVSRYRCSKCGFVWERGENQRNAERYVVEVKRRKV